MMENFQFENVDTRPLYIQALTLITEYLEKGGFKTRRCIAARGSHGTAARGFPLHVARSNGAAGTESRVIRRQGIGTFVAEPPGAASPVGLETLSLLSRVLRAHGQDVEVVYHEVSIVPVTGEVLSIFRIEPGSAFNPSPACTCEPGCASCVL